MSICIGILKNYPTKLDLLEALQSMMSPIDKEEINGVKKYYLNSLGDFLIHVLNNNLTGDEKLDINQLLVEIEGFKNEYYFQTILKCDKKLKDICTLLYVRGGREEYFNKYDNFWNTFDFCMPILKTIPYKKGSIFDEFTFHVAEDVIFTRINPYYVEIYLSLLLLLDYLVSKIQLELESKMLFVKEVRSFFIRDRPIVLIPRLYINKQINDYFKRLDEKYGSNILNTYKCYSNLYDFLCRFNYFAVSNVLSYIYFDKQLKGRELIPFDEYNDLTFEELCGRITELENKVIETKDENYNTSLEVELCELYEVELEMNVIEAQIENQAKMLEYMKQKNDQDYSKTIERMFSIIVPPEFKSVKDNFNSLTIKQIREFAINTNMYSYRNYIPTCKEVVFLNYSFENSISLDEVTGNEEDIFMPKRWVKVDFYNTILEDYYHFDFKYTKGDLVEDDVIEDINPEFILPKWYIENYSEYMVSIGKDGYIDYSYLDFFFEPREMIYYR